MHENQLSDSQKRILFNDGFVVLKDVVPRNITDRAKQLIQKNPSLIVYGDNAAINDLYNASPLRTLMLEVMGPHSAPVNAQVAVTQPGFSDAVVRNKISSQHHPKTHVDGGWAGLCPVKRSEIKAAGESLDTWGTNGDPKSKGPAGGAPLWQDRQKTLAIGSYTAIVGICLSDQLKPGKGQFGVRRSAHEAVEAYFRMQRDRGGPLGGGGPGWPRLVAMGEDAAFAGIMPNGMESTYPRTRFESDDWPWPEITPVLMEEGDAVVALHSIPHTATPNFSQDPRMNVYFRIRRHRPENPYEGEEIIGWGVSDHPDRTLNGDFLEYPASYDPYKTSIEKLCDHWSEWDGMQHIVNSM